MFGDFLRFWWALGYWNARKTLFVFRGAQGRAPCQNPCDSGRAGETACEASMHWRRPRRFRAVCPALRETPQGWRCSLDAAAVRPFWGRAVVAGAVASVVLSALGTLCAWGGLRAVGYRELRYADFWSVRFPARLRTAQAGYYRRQAEAAFAAGDFGRGAMALSVAFDRDPRDLDTGLLLAQLLQRTRQAERGDGLFERLLRDFPARGDEIATAWAAALTVREDYAALTALAARRAGAGGRGSAFWMRTLVFGLRQIEAEGFAAAADGAEAALPATWREVVTAERRLRAGDARAVRTMLAAPTLLNEPFAVLFRVETLLGAGAVDEAATILDQGGTLLGRFHRNLLGWRIAAARGSTATADLVFDDLVQPPLLPEKIDLLCAELLRRPAPGRVAELFAAVEQAGGIPARGDVQVALLVAAAAADDGARVAAVVARSRTVSPGSEAGLRKLAIYLRGGPEAESLRALLDTLPVPRELTFALLETRRSR